jgi:hypothetical protein
MNQIVLKSLNILLFILVIFLVSYIIPSIFAQDVSTIQDNLEKIKEEIVNYIQDTETIDNNDSINSILSVSIPSASFFLLL